MGYLWDKSDEQIRRDAARANNPPRRKKRKPQMERVHDAATGKTTTRQVRKGGRVHSPSNPKGRRFRTGQHND